MYKPLLYFLSRPWARLALCLTFLLYLGVGPAWAQVSVLTQHNNNSRTGANLNETTLTTANVNASNFGKLFSMSVDGFVYAQPLYLPSVNLPNLSIHNVLFVATAHNSVYAFDADTGAQLWKVSLGTPVPSSVINTPAIQVEVGIISTPVIDSSTNTLYVVPKTYENSVQIYRLHALDILTGAEKLGGPKQIAAHYPGSGDPGAGDPVVGGQVQFDTAMQLQRSAVTLVNGVIYLAFASHEDYPPYHGWVLAYNAANLQQVATYNDTPNSLRGGIWMSGQGLVADNDNNVYLISGNSRRPLENAAGDYGQSFVKLGLSGNALSVIDYFKPFNYDALNTTDVDLGSGGPVAIPGTVYIVGGGKQGLLYLVNTTTGLMGELNSTSDKVVQEFQADNGLWGSPVFWNNPSAPTLYVWGVNDSLKAFRYNFSTGKFNTTVAAASSIKTPNGDDPCGALSVSSNQSLAGTGILWATIPLADPAHATVQGKLYAFDATNVGKELWDSGQNALRDDYGNFAKFVPPTVANGKVYIATDSEQVCVYGLNPPAAVWHHRDISALATAPPAAGDPSGYVLGSEVVVYRGTDNHVYAIFGAANQGPWSHADLTALTNAPLAAGNPFGFVHGAQAVVYRGTDNDIHHLYTVNNNTQWAQEDLTKLAGAPTAAGDPFALPSGPSGRQIITYRDTNGNVQVLWSNGPGAWAHSDLTSLTNAPLSAGDPWEYIKGSNTQIVPFRAAVDSHIHALYTINNNSQWTQLDVSGSAQAPLAASDPIGYVFGTQYMDYRGADNHIHQLFVPGTAWVTADLTNIAGAPLATGDPFGYVASSPLIVYKDTNNDIDELFGSGTQWAFADLSKSAGAPPSAGDPFAYTFGNQVVVYRGTDGHIHLLSPQ
jgi:outer membrane protein assembly factor BamB